MNVTTIVPGLVLIKKGLTPEQQTQLATIVQQLHADHKFQQSGKYRDRIYGAINTYPEHQFLSCLCTRITELARQHDPTIKPMSPTHLLLLYYAGKNGMGYHRDDGENDGDEDYPIVSFSIGNTCRFGVKTEIDGELHEEIVLLESGDVIMFGGPSRHILHSVKNVKQNTAPSEIKSIIGDTRINYTFRYVPTVLGKEHNYFIFDAQTNMCQSND